MSRMRDWEWKREEVKEEDGRATACTKSSCVQSYMEDEMKL